MTDIDDKSLIEITLKTTVYPNAVVIKIEILDGDADGRAKVETAIKMAVRSVLAKPEVSTVTEAAV